MSEAPERIGLVANPFGYSLWNSVDYDDPEIAINYVRADLHEALVKERDDACRYLESWLVSFCSEHFPENKNWRPLTGDLIGMLTQADNASTIARDLRKERDTLAADKAELLAALEKLVAAEALKGVRELVAGWNGENRPEGPYAERHPVKLGATLPKTNCGAVYELDEAMQKARAALARHAAPAKGEV